jgi:hypothetical protein
MAETEGGFRTDVGWNASALTPVHWLAMVLSVITGAIHVYLYTTQGRLPFLFAGVVFVAAVVALLFNVYPLVLYALGIPFTAGQVVLWVVAGTPEMEVGIVDKAVQVLLVVVLAYLLYTTWKRRQQELMR